MRYHLSNRQLKELSRGNGLDIAIPAPAGRGDPDRYVRRVLVGIDADEIRIVRTKTLTINPLWHGAGDPDTTPARIIGTIVNEPADREEAKLTIQVVCYVARISSERYTESQYPCQWPGRIEWND